MIEHYAWIKQAHMTAAGASLALFVLRSGWSVRGSSMLARRWVKVVPHLVDTVLLGLGVTLMATLSLWPHQHPWLAAKLLALLAYIGLGSVAVKRGATPARRGAAAVAAVAVFVYMLGAAIRHSPLSWLA